MSKLTKNKIFSIQPDWTDEMISTAVDVYNKRRDTFERLGHSKRDSVLIAVAAVNILEKHGKNSPLFRDFIYGLKIHVSGWESEDYRRNLQQAARGFLKLPGDESDKEFIWKLNPSLSALAECQNLPKGRGWDFIKALKGKVKFPSAGAIAYFGDNGQFPLSTDEKRLLNERKQENAKPKLSSTNSNYQVSTPSVPSEASDSVVETSFVSIDETEDILTEPIQTNEPINVTPMIADSAVLDCPVTDYGTGSAVLYRAVESFAFEKRRSLSDNEKSDLLRMLHVLKQYCGVSL